MTSASKPLSATGADVAFRWFDIRRDASSWDRQVSDLGQSMFHLSALLEAHRTGRARTRGVCVEQEGGIKSVVGGLWDETAGSFSSLSFPKVEEKWARDLPQRLTSWFAEQGLCQAEFGSFFGGVEPYSTAVPGWTTTGRLEFVLDLKVDPEERRKRVSSTMKGRLNKHARQGFVLSECNRRSVQILNAVIEERLNRQGKSLGLLGRVADFLTHWRLVQRLLHSGVARMYTLSGRDGQLLGATLMLEHGDRVFYMMGGCTKAGYEASSAFTLLWRLSEKYAEGGFRVLNLGGVPAGAQVPGAEQHGLYRFKTSFGAEVVERLSLQCRLIAQAGPEGERHLCAQRA